MSVWTTAGLIADGTFDDPANARVIYLAVAGLVLLAVLLGVGTWWWWRSSKVEHPVLAPLEVMGTRRWWRSDFNERQRRLESVRAAHVDGDADELVVGADAIDLDHVLVRDDPHTFDDLIDPDAPIVADEAEAASADRADVEPAAEAVEPEVVEPADAEHDVVEPAAVAESVEGEQPAADAAAADDAEPDAAEPDAEPIEAVSAVAAASAAEPEATADEPSEVLEPALRSIVIDTAPKPRDTPPDLGPEAVDTDPTPVPIDPLLRLQAE